MSCQGLRNSALRKCMKKYLQESKRRFPTFNQVTDTVITRKSNAPSGISRVTERLKERRNQDGPTVFTKGSGSSPFISRTMFKKK